jgi:outer membrane protein assembly factor BamB
MVMMIHRVLKTGLYFAVICMVACAKRGDGRLPTKAAEEMPTPSDLEVAGTNKEEGKEPNVPFAMMGGGPRHVYRVQVPGPRSAPQEIASFRIGNRVFASPVIGPDGTVYIGGIDGTFNALRLDGTLRWSYVCNEPIFSTAAISLSGVVYVGCDDDTLLAFSTDGTVRWTYAMKQDVDSSPVIGQSGVIYVGGEGLHAILPNGKRQFKIFLGGHVSASPAQRPDGMIVVGSHDHRVYAVLTDGTVAWSFGTKGPVQGAVACLKDNDIVFGSDDGFVYRLSPMGGSRWKVKTGGPVRAGVAVSEDEQAIFVASMDGRVYGLDAKTGKELWHIATVGQIRSTPVLGSEGRLYFGSRDHHLYAVDAANGELKWRVDLGSEIDSTLAVTSGRKIVVGSDDGTVHILGEMR